MSDKSKPRRLSEAVVPGRDYEAKVKISDILDRDVLLLSFEIAEGSQEFAKVDPDTGEVVSRDYWNIAVDDGGSLKTFSTGAIPIDKVLKALRAKIEVGEAELPLLAMFRKEGRTFTIS
jgi:hypothetical protein